MPVSLSPASSQYFTVYSLPWQPEIFSHESLSCRTIVFLSFAVVLLCALICVSMHKEGSVWIFAWLFSAGYIMFGDQLVVPSVIQAVYTLLMARSPGSLRFFFIPFLLLSSLFPDFWKAEHKGGVWGMRGIARCLVTAVTDCPQSAELTKAAFPAPCVVRFFFFFWVNSLVLCVHSFRFHRTLRTRNRPPALSHSLLLSERLEEYWCVGLLVYLYDIIVLCGALQRTPNQSN